MAEETRKQSKVGKFFRDYKSEFKKIVWPTWNDTLRQSGVVIAAIIICSVAVLVLDTGFSKLFEFLRELALRV